MYTAAARYIFIFQGQRSVNVVSWRIVILIRKADMLCVQLCRGDRSQTRCPPRRAVRGNINFWSDDGLSSTAHSGIWTTSTSIGACPFPVTSQDEIVTPSRQGCPKGTLIIDFSVKFNSSSFEMYASQRWRNRPQTSLADSFPTRAVANNNQAQGELRRRAYPTGSQGMYRPSEAA